MSQPIIPREQAAERFAVPTRVLIRYESRGLVRAVREGSAEGYGPAEIRRLWSIVSYQRDLGINLAGVEALLKLQDHLAEVHRRLHDVTDQLREAIEAQHDGPA